MLYDDYGAEASSVSCSEEFGDLGIDWSPTPPFCPDTIPPFVLMAAYPTLQAMER